MPGDTIAMHPDGIQITFTEDDHRYVDNLGMDYTSVTTMIHDSFPQFDAEAVAARKAQRDGGTVQGYLDQWKKAGDDAGYFGTRMHENCEYQLLEQYDKMHQPLNEPERVCFAAAWEQVNIIKAIQPRVIMPEMIVFSPAFNIAGSIDLLIQKQDGSYIIADWKRVKQLKQQAFNNETGLTPATWHLPNCNYYHYALQLSIYELILKIEGYISFNIEVAHVLLVFDLQSQQFNQWVMPNLQREAALLLLENVRRMAVHEPIGLPF